MENQPQNSEPIQNQPLENLPTSQPKPDKKLVIVAIVVAILALAAIGAGAYFWWQTFNNSGQRACTMEAKLCPDGSYVGRTGPNCEFAECPAESGEGEESACQNLCGDGVCQEIVCMAIGCPCPESAESCPQDCANNGFTPSAVEGWQTYRNEKYGFEVKYPINLNMKSEKVTFGQSVGDEVFFLENGRLFGFTISIFTASENETAKEAFSRIYSVDVPTASKSTKSIAGITADYYKDIPSYSSYDEVFLFAMASSMGYQNLHWKKTSLTKSFPLSNSLINNATRIYE